MCINVFSAGPEFASGPKFIQNVLFAKRENRCAPTAGKNGMMGSCVGGFAGWREALVFVTPL